MIYIQSNKEKTRAHHFDAASAQFGAVEEGLDWRYVTFEEVVSGAKDLLLRQNLFAGSSEFMKAVFKRMNMDMVGVPRNSNREHTYMTLGAARTLARNGRKVFIKPVENKVFSGFVLDQMQYASIAKVPEDTLLMAYEPFEHTILSEWRLYVRDHRIIYAANYAGDFFKSPNWVYGDKIVKENEKDFPCAYVMDLALLSNWETVVVEFNDMWAIGNYGMPNDLYLKMLRARYFEIIRSK